MIIAALVCFPINIVFEALGNPCATFIALPVNFFITSAIYGGMIKEPETGPIGFAKGLLISFYLLLIGFVLGLIVGLFLIVVMIAAR